MHRRLSRPVARGVGLCLALMLTMSSSAWGQGAASAPRPAPASVDERLTQAALAHRSRLDHDGARFGGPAWDRLLDEGRAARMFLLGEEHGIAENPRLAAALFTALVPAGYRHMAIEVSPPMAHALDRAARDGIDGLRRLFETPGNEPAFFGMREEAEMLVTARAAVTGSAPVFWGLDYEVGGDRLLLSTLAAMPVPSTAAAPLARLQAASAEAWGQYASSGDISRAFSFAGDPALVRAVRSAWPTPDARAEALLESLEETLAINHLWVSRRGFDSNLRRADFLRANFLRQWRAALAAAGADSPPRVFAKLGASHLVRGRNSNEVFDVGTLAPELAQAAGGHAFHLMVLPGPGATTAVLNPAIWRYEPAKQKDGYMRGLAPLLAAAHDDAFTLIDLRPLRPILGRWGAGTDPELMRVVHGFDMLLVMSGSTPSANLRPAKP